MSTPVKGSLMCAVLNILKRKICEERYPVLHLSYIRVIKMYLFLRFCVCNSLVSIVTACILLYNDHKSEY